MALQKFCWLCSVTGQHGTWRVTTTRTSRIIFCFFWILFLLGINCGITQCKTRWTICLWYYFCFNFVLLFRAGICKQKPEGGLRKLSVAWTMAGILMRYFLVMCTQSIVDVSDYTEFMWITMWNDEEAAVRLLLHMRCSSSGNQTALHYILHIIIDWAFNWIDDALNFWTNDENSNSKIVYANTYIRLPQIFNCKLYYSCWVMWLCRWYALVGIQLYVQCVQCAGRQMDHIHVEAVLWYFHNSFFGWMFDMASFPGLYWLHPIIFFIFLVGNKKLNYNPWFRNIAEPRVSAIN